MKPSEIKAGKTYQSADVGRNAQRRVISISSIGMVYYSFNTGKIAGIMTTECSLDSFAKWAGKAMNETL